MLSDEKSTNRINMTPLVDVCLTLVLVFMVTMPLSVIHGIQVKRKALNQYGLTTPQENVVVHLTGDGVFIEDEKGKEQRIPYRDFGNIFRQMIRISTTGNLLLKVDRDVPHGQTVWALDIAKQNGADDISLFESE